MLETCRKSVINARHKTRKCVWNLSPRSRTSQRSTNAVLELIFSLAHAGILLPSLPLEVMLNILLNNRRRCYRQEMAQKPSLSLLLHENIWPPQFGFVWQEFAGYLELCISCRVIRIKGPIPSPTASSLPTERWHFPSCYLESKGQMEKISHIKAALS